MDMNTYHDSDDNLFCPNCFKKIKTRNRCPQCQFDRFEKHNSMALDDNTLLLNKYIIGKVLGSGGFGITYKAYDLLENKVCAIKEYVPLGLVSREKDRKTIVLADESCLKQFEHGKKRFMDEANVLKSLDYNPVVANIFDYFYENGTCYFVMEYIDGLTLSQMMEENEGKILYEDMIPIMEQVLECIDLVHQKSDIFHRDISPDNIIVANNGEVRLIDFGNAKYISNLENQYLSIVLKQGFAPLEQYSSSSKQGAYTDVYALASTFYYCLTGVKVPSALSRISSDSMKPLAFYLGDEYGELSDIFYQALQLKYQHRTQKASIFLQQIKDFDRIFRKNYYDVKEQACDQGSMEDNQGNADQKEESMGQTGEKTPYILGVYGPLKGYRFKIPSNLPITLGRSSECQIQIKDCSTISRRHLDVFFDSIEEIFYLENYSKNGTNINDIKCEIGEYYRLKEGAYISLSNGVCVFQVGVINE